MTRIMKSTMTEDQFKRLLEQNNAVFFGQLSRHFDKQLGALRDELKDETDRIYNAVDGIAKRLETDEQERTAINAEQRRQNGWIGQLAKASNTKLIPEQ
jgi:hypothetical protein